MFVYTRTAHYHETDQMGVVHHANYPKWMEEARVAFLDELGVSYGAMESAGVFSPVVHLSIDYKRPARFDDEVEVQLAIAKYTGVRLEVGYTFFNRTRNELCATAASAHCFVKDGRVVSLQRALPAAHERLLACLREENAL